MRKIVTQSEYTSALVSQRNDLADNIDAMGVEAEQTEKLNTLVPKVLEIGGGGVSGAPLIVRPTFAAPMIEMQAVDETDFAAQVRFAASDCIGFEFEEETA